MTLLGYERGEAAATFPLMFRTELDRLLALAKERGRARRSDRSASGWRGATRKVEIMRYLGLRTLTQFLAGAPARARRRRSSSCTGASTTRMVTELAVDILGADAMAPTVAGRRSSFQTDDAGAPNDSASWVGAFFNARAGTIYAGTSQIQRNIIGEMVLGLPKEPKRRHPPRGAKSSPAPALEDSVAG